MYIHEYLAFLCQKDHFKGWGLLPYFNFNMKVQLQLKMFFFCLFGIYMSFTQSFKVHEFLAFLCQKDHFKGWGSFFFPLVLKLKLAFKKSLKTTTFTDHHCRTAGDDNDDDE